MNKILIITYYWPPGAGAGVQRWLKFAKYLPEYGFEPVILTVDPGYAAYPFPDPSLEREIPQSLKVYKTPAYDFFRLFSKDKSRVPAAGFATGKDTTLKGRFLRFIRGNFFIPDPRRGWNRYAFRKACEITETEKISRVITTSPPHSTQLIGLRLKKRYPGIKWIADLRDPWTDIYYYDKFYPLWPARTLDAYYEKRTLRSADRIITVGKSLKKLFVSKVPDSGIKTEVIHNGYDPEDFTGISASVNDTFTVSYIGTLSDAYPLTGLLDALNLFSATGRDFRLRFVGSVTPEQTLMIKSSVTAARAEFVPYANHNDAIRFMLESSVLLLIIPDDPGNKCIITGKLFEYLATGRPILCLGPADGDAAEIIKETGHGAVLQYYDSAAIFKYLDGVFEDPVGSQKVSYERFSRKRLAGELASML